jgi:polyvinyl alcohol dehydrogenase (cytochrome)
LRQAWTLRRGAIFGGVEGRLDGESVFCRDFRRTGAVDGWLRAYSAEDGRIVWEVDTKGDYQAINGVAAKGGSLDGGGAVVVDGMLYVGSGSGIFGGTPGNVLLAYSVDGL